MTKKLKDKKKCCKQNLKNKENKANFSKRNHKIRIVQAKDYSSKISKPSITEKYKILEKFINPQKTENSPQTSKTVLGRSPTQYGFQRNKIKDLKKGQWSLQEDKLLKEWIQEFGPRKWEKCGIFIHGRSAKQCWEHWNNCINPGLIKGEWTSEEDFLIMEFYEKCNGNWKKIILLFNGRTKNSIKNRFFSQLRKIATKNINVLERKIFSKIKLKELKNFLPEAVSEAKNKFLSDNPMTQEEFKNYLNKMELKIKKKMIQNIDMNDTIFSINLGDSKGENTENSFIEKRKWTSNESLMNNSDDSFEENKIKIKKDEIAFDYSYINNNYDNEEKNDTNKSNEAKNNYYINGEISTNQICELKNYNDNISFNNDIINNNECDLKNTFFKSLYFRPNNLLEDLHSEHKSSYDFFQNIEYEENSIIGNYSIRNSGIKLF